jgi:hypothetical protein
MAAAFESASGSLATRLVASLVAAETMGGDARGRMSAALIVVDGARHNHSWEGVLTNVRVDHHPDPLPELARLAQVAEAYHLCDVAEEALVRGDAPGALAGSEAGLALLPGEASRPPWEGVLRALIDRGLVPMPEGVTLDLLLTAPPHGDRSGGPG